MSVSEYKEALKSLIDSTNNETLLKHWKRQLEWDVENESEIELSSAEWSLVQEGVADYKSGQIISLEEFVSKRK
jgi:hypothetical protein